MGMDPGRYCFGAVDHCQISRGRFLAVRRQPDSANNASTSEVNTLNMIYPELQQNLYYVPTTTEQTDTTQQLRFPNVDKS